MDEPRALNLGRSFVPVLFQPSGAVVAGKAGAVTSERFSVRLIQPSPASGVSPPSPAAPFPEPFFPPAAPKGKLEHPKKPPGKPHGGLEPFRSCWMNKSLLNLENWGERPKLDVLKAGHVFRVHPGKALCSWDEGMGNPSWIGAALLAWSGLRKSPSG